MSKDKDQGEPETCPLCHKIRRTAAAVTRGITVFCTCAVVTILPPLHAWPSRPHIAPSSELSMAWYDAAHDDPPGGSYTPWRASEVVVTGGTVSTFDGPGPEPGGFI